MLTRRAVLATPIAASALVASQRRLFAAPSMIRHDVASPEGKAMLRIYARGVKAMQALPVTDPRSWDWQWYMHAGPKPKEALIQSVFGRRAGPARALAEATWWTCQAHHRPPENEAYFLAWHRLYLLHFEAIVRTLTGEVGFTLPYWDYTDSNRAALPEEFQDRFATDPDLGVLHVANRNVDDGQLFANVNAGEPINKYFKGRENFLTLADMQAPDYGGGTGFNQALDNNLHGSIHSFVGNMSNMGDIPTAARDPIFWIHHCNIDRIWCGWSKAGGRNPTDAAWAPKSFTFIDAQGRASVVAVRTIADSAKLDYGYDKLPAPPKPLRPQAVAVRRLHAVAHAAPMVMAAAAPAAAAATTATGPITLGATPKDVTISAAPPLVGAAPPPRRHRATRPGTPQPMTEATPAPPVEAGSPQRLVLTLNSVQAHTAPGVVYKVYLDLPQGAAQEVVADHFVGLLNFFDKVGMPAVNSPGMTMGKTVAFDITDLADRIRGPGEADSDFKISLVPVGKLNAGSEPMILGGVQIRRE